jgi:hypothetical protein
MRFTWLWIVYSVGCGQILYLDPCDRCRYLEMTSLMSGYSGKLALWFHGTLFSYFCDPINILWWLVKWGVVPPGDGEIIHHDKFDVTIRKQDRPMNTGHGSGRPLSGRLTNVCIPDNEWHSLHIKKEHGLRRGRSTTTIRPNRASPVLVLVPELTLSFFWTLTLSSFWTLVLTVTLFIVNSHN